MAGIMHLFEFVCVCVCVSESMHIIYRVGNGTLSIHTLLAVSEWKLNIKKPLAWLLACVSVVKCLKVVVAHTHTHKTGTKK